jgi:hypothetical protein
VLRSPIEAAHPDREGKEKQRKMVSATHDKCLKKARILPAYPFLAAKVHFGSRLSAVKSACAEHSSTPALPALLIGVPPCRRLLLALPLTGRCPVAEQPLGRGRYVSGIAPLTSQPILSPGVSGILCKRVFV